jgi:hypothetical protein
MTIEICYFAARNKSTIDLKFIYAKKTYARFFSYYHPDFQSEIADDNRN